MVTFWFVFWSCHGFLLILKVSIQSERWPFQTFWGLFRGKMKTASTRPNKWSPTRLISAAQKEYGQYVWNRLPTTALSRCPSLSVFFAACYTDGIGRSRIYGNQSLEAEALDCLAGLFLILPNLLMQVGMDEEQKNKAAHHAAESTQRLCSSLCHLQLM